eukprot:11790414-Alexandrium_andersonii.AAC.1
MPSSESAPPGSSNDPEQRRGSPADYGWCSPRATSLHRVMRLAACHGPSNGPSRATSRLVATGRLE